jgi:hypothetical protein
MATFAAMAPTSTAQAESAKRKVSPGVERRGDLARKARRPVRPLKGILKKPRLGQHKLGGGSKKVQFNLKARRPGPGYADYRKRRNTTKKILDRRAKTARGARKPARGVHRGAKAARQADRARKARNTARAVKLVRGAKYLAAGTGVLAVVGATAGLAGVDPVEMAALKATNPAEYERRMRDLKKNPMKYMGKSIKNNTKKIGQGVKNGTKKVGQGLKNGTKKFGQGVKKIFVKKKN